MISSPPNHSCPWLLNVFFFLLLRLFCATTGVGGVQFTFVNKCSEPIWPMVLNNAAQQSAEYAVPIGRSVVVQRPSNWSGQIWAKTGCTFNDSRTASCLTGDNTPYTLAEFALGSYNAMDFYDVSLVNGYNLPLVVKPVGGNESTCNSTGCVHDVNQVCPTELRTQGGAACRSPCDLYRTPEYCCNKGSCGPTDFSKVFKKACPTAYSYPKDDATSTFTCTGAVEYFITFCPPNESILDIRFGSVTEPSYAPLYVQVYNASASAPAPPLYVQVYNASASAPAPALYVQVYNAPASAPAPASASAPAPSFSYPPHTVNNNSQQRKKGNKRAKEIITIVSSVSISGLIIIAITISYFLKRRHFQNGPKRKRKKDVENLLLQYGSLAPKRYRYSEIKKMTKSLSDKLGQGGFGSVYKGTLPDGRLVAVKNLNEIDSNGEEFINEVASISRTSHVNIVSLLGFCYERNKSALVYEYMPNKSLDKFISNNESVIFIDNKKLYEIAVGIAKGLEYLHKGCITRIVHFDIKPQNILLDDDLCPKISDFGLAKLCKKKQSAMSVSGTRGTAGYIAPEVFSRNFGAVSHKSDVYSYGMMLLEMAGTRKNVGFQRLEMQLSENYFPDKIYEQVMIDVTSNLDESTMNEEGVEVERIRKLKMMLIGFWCIQTIPSERPSISKVVEMLEGSVESIEIPPKPLLTSTVIPRQQTSSSFSVSGDTDNSVVN